MGNMLNWLTGGRKSKLEDQLAKTDAKLALMNAQMAAELIRLAGQTDDLAPLAQAEEAIQSARKYYAYENTPVEIGMVQIALGDMLLKLGRAQNDLDVMARARAAYRTAITLASMHGDEDARHDLRNKVRIVESLLGHHPKVPSLFKVA